MARTAVTVTISWVEVLSATTGSIYVNKIGEGVLLVNDAGVDAGALAIKQDDGPRKQVEIKGAIDTFVRATGTGWEIVTDDGYMVIL